MKFCSECGTQLEDDARVCPKCNAQVKPSAKPKVMPNKIAVIGFIISAIAFIMGFIIVTTIFATKRYGALTNAYFMCLLPSFAGLGLGFYKLLDSGSDKPTKFVSVINIISCGFVLFYIFVATMVAIA